MSQLPVCKLGWRCSDLDNITHLLALEHVSERLEFEDTYEAVLSGHITPESAQDRLSDLLWLFVRHDEATTRLAAWKLCELETKHETIFRQIAGALFLAKLSSPTPDVAVLCCAADAIHEPVIIRACIALLETGNHVDAIAQVLHELSGSWAVAWRQYPVTQLDEFESYAKKFATSSIASIRVCAVSILCGVCLICDRPEARRAIMLMTRDEDPAVRAAVCKSFSLRPNEQGDDVLEFVVTCLEAAPCDLEATGGDIALQACEYIMDSLSNNGDVIRFQSRLPRIIPRLFLHMQYADEDPVDVVSEIDDDGWNLRKAAASALDEISQLTDEVTELLWPLLEIAIQDENWKVRESAVLAAGALASSPPGLVVKDNLIHTVFSLMHSKEPVRVREIACWTASRYHCFLAAAAAEVQQQFVRDALACMTEGKKIAHVACTCLATLAEEQPQIVDLCIEAVMPSMVEAFAHFDEESLPPLCDAVATIAESKVKAGPYLDEVVMRLGALAAPGTPSSVLLPALEALTSHLGADHHYPAGLLEKPRAFCLSMLGEDKEEARAIDDDDHTQWVTCALDLLAAMIEAEGEAAAPFAATCSTWLEEHGLESTHADVLQSCLAMMGDLAKGGFLTTEYSARVMPKILRVLQTHAHARSVQSNAFWAIGELLVIGLSRDSRPRDSDDVIPHMSELSLVLLAAVSNNAGVNPAVALGRLAMRAPRAIAALSPDFDAWIRPLERDLVALGDLENIDLLRGVCAVLHELPVAVCLPILPIMVHITSAPDDLCTSFGFYLCRLNDEGLWDHVPRDVRVHLAEQYPVGG